MLFRTTVESSSVEIAARRNVSFLFFSYLSVVLYGGNQSLESLLSPVTSRVGVIESAFVIVFVVVLMAVPIGH